MEVLRRVSSVGRSEVWLGALRVRMFQVAIPIGRRRLMMGEVGGGRLGGPLPSGFGGDPSLSLPLCPLVRGFCGPSRGPLRILVFVATEIGNTVLLALQCHRRWGVTCPRLPPGLWREGVTLLLHSSLVYAELPAALKMTLRHSEIST